VKLLFATTNPHKVEELRRALPGWEIDPWAAPDPPVEDGATFEQNARIKALHARTHTPGPVWVAGEDSGIEASALGGRPGVESARWAADGVQALLAALDGEEDRGARYVSVIVAMSTDGDELVATGTLEGAVAAEPRGSGGFGYDPIVVPRGETQTVAELGDAWKAANSHRARAAQSLAQQLARVASR
jgi:XTP/dITP diphosphohydrolase